MTNTLLRIDGSQGEGGGQIVRSSLTLALVTGRPFVIDKIRAGRDKPGLMRQHLTAVQAAAQICSGEVEGVEIASRGFRFQPKRVRPGKYHFSVGTAGSATLVLQTVLPALLIADGPSELILEGGTHNPWAPPFDFLERSFLPLVNRMGPRVTAVLERAGFYPAGGGKFTVTIEPSATLRAFDLLERGETVSRVARAVIANLPEHIAEREVDRIIGKMSWDSACGRIERATAHGPGNVVVIEIHSTHVTEVFTAFGRKNVRAEKVADEVVEEARRYLTTSAPVGPHLADQLLLPFGISAWQEQNAAQRGGAFRTAPLTRHSLTHIDILRQFLGIDVQVAREAIGPAETCLVTIAPRVRESAPRTPSTLA